MSWYMGLHVAYESEWGGDHGLGSFCLTDDWVLGGYAFLMPSQEITHLRSVTTFNEKVGHLQYIQNVGQRVGIFRRPH